MEPGLGSKEKVADEVADDRQGLLRSPDLHKGGAGLSWGGISAHCNKWGRTKGCNVMRLLWWRHLQVWSKSSSWGLGDGSGALPSQLSLCHGAYFQPLSPTQLGPGHERLQVPEVPGGAQQPERYSRASGSLPFVLAVCVNTCCGVCCMGSLLSINP